MKKKIKAPYVPVVKSLGDVSNFEEYPDSNNNTPATEIKPNIDPFLTWWSSWLYAIIIYPRKNNMLQSIKTEFYFF